MGVKVVITRQAIMVTAIVRLSMYILIHVYIIVMASPSDDTGYNTMRLLRERLIS